MYFLDKIDRYLTDVDSWFTKLLNVIFLFMRSYNLAILFCFLFFFFFCNNLIYQLASTNFFLTGYENQKLLLPMIFFWSIHLQLIFSSTFSYLIWLIINCFLLFVFVKLIGSHWVGHFLSYFSFFFFQLTYVGFLFEITRWLYI